MSTHIDEYEKGLKNLNNGPQGLAIQLAVCVCMSKNEITANDCILCTHEWALNPRTLRQNHYSEEAVQKMEMTRLTCQ